jgi:hypothetical protein
MKKKTRSILGCLPDGGIACATNHDTLPVDRAGSAQHRERLHVLALGVIQQCKVVQAYGLASNKDFVRHGGTASSKIGKEEAEFFLEFSAAAILYITSKLTK